MLLANLFLLGIANFVIPTLGAELLSEKYLIIVKRILGLAIFWLASFFLVWFSFKDSLNAAKKCDSNNTYLDVFKSGTENLFSIWLIIWYLLLAAFSLYLVLDPIYS